jgi:DNA replication initiation complex subunit (GINS family)
MSEIITYEILYEILRKEKFERDLQKIEPNFFEAVIKYLEEKEAILESQKNKDSLFSKESDKTQKQLENIRKILREIYEKRENKIVQYGLVSSRFNESKPQNMLDEEIKFYLELKNTLNKYRKCILENLILKKMPSIKEEILEKAPAKIETIKEEPLVLGNSEEKEDARIKLVRFLQPVPQFIADDLIIYGPFENEDVASLPKDVANLLVKKNKVEEVNPS